MASVSLNYLPPVPYELALTLSVPSVNCRQAAFEATLEAYSRPYHAINTHTSRPYYNQFIAYGLPDRQTEINRVTHIPPWMSLFIPPYVLIATHSVYLPVPWHNTTADSSSSSGSNGSFIFTVKRDAGRTIQSNFLVL